MNRLLLVALVLASCSKAKKEAAPATTATPPKSEEPGRNSGSAATELARNQGGLGVSAPTEAFEPIEGGSGSGKGRDPAKPVTDPERRTLPKPSSYAATITAVTVGDKPAPEALTQAVNVQGSDIQVCYDKAIAKKPDIAGTVKLTFTFLKTGGIANLTFSGKTLGQFDMENCVMDALNRIKVAKPPADKVDATVTITFAKK